MAPLAPHAPGTLDAAALPSATDGPATPTPQARVQAPPAPVVDEVYNPAADPDNGWTPGRPRLGDLTAEQVHRARFRTVGSTGYAQVDVDDFLDQVEATLLAWESRAAQPADATAAPGRPAALDRWPFVRESRTDGDGRTVAPSGLTLISRGLGYDVGEVDSFLEHAAVALELLAQGVTPEMTPVMVEGSLFHMTLDSGYDQQEVDQLLDQVAEVLRRGPRARRTAVNA